MCCHINLFQLLRNQPREGLRLLIVERSARRRVYRATMNPDITWVLLRTVEHLQTSAERVGKTEVLLDKLKGIWNAMPQR